MKLRNKQTGKIVEWFNNTDGILPNTLAELNEEWEDYEEPKEHWYINDIGEPEKEGKCYIHEMEPDKMQEIGNYFNSREEAEKAVEKLKAWKRLKDNGFRLSAVVDTFFCLDVYMKGESYEAIKDDLKIVFGDEE